MQFIPRHNLGLTYLFMLLFLSIQGVGCFVDGKEELIFFEVKTLAPELKKLPNVIMKGEVTGLSDERTFELEYGFIWSDNTPDVDFNTPNIGIFTMNGVFSVGNEAFNSDEIALSLNKDLYFIRAYVKMGARIVLGDLIILQLSDQYSIIMSGDILVKNNEATVNGIVVGLEAENSVANDHGFVYSSINEVPNIDSTDSESVSLGTLNRDGGFSIGLKNLAFNQTYYIRSFIEVGGEVLYSKNIGTIRLKDGWLDKGMTPISRRRLIVEQLGQTIYFGLGCSYDCISTDIGLKKMWTLSINENGQVSIHELAPFPGQPRTDAISFVIDSFLYIGLGSIMAGNDRVYFDDLWQFNPTQGPIGTWRAMNGMKDPQNPSEDLRRDGAFAFVLNSRAYVGGGKNDVAGLSIKSDFYEFIPPGNTIDQGSWRRLDDLPLDDGSGNQFTFGRYEATAFTLNERGYLGLGRASIVLTDFWEFTSPQHSDPDDHGSWDFMGNYPGAPRYGAMYFTDGTVAYLGFGRSNATDLLNDFWKFDPRSNSNYWETIDNCLVEKLSNGIGFMVNDKGYIGFGEVEGINRVPIPRNRLWEYTPLK